MLDWYTMIEKEPKEGDRFVALYNDGSGARLFEIIKGELFEAEGGDEPCHGEELDNYFYWALLPDDFKFWSDKNE